MKKFRILKHVLKSTGTTKLLMTFFAFILVTSYGVFVVESNGGNPGIVTYFDALYFTFVTFCTVGFGDIVAVTFVGKILTMSLMVYGVLVIGLITGIFATFYEELNQRRTHETVYQFMDKLEHLQDLSKDDLEKLSKRIIKYNNK